MTPPDQNDVFVSYKREDRHRVEPLVTCLRGAGLDVWWDADIPGGSTWRAEILSHLHGARCVVVVWSDASVSADGDFVHEEATHAKRRGLLLPVAIDAVTPPLGFGQIQSLDLTGWTGDSDDVRVANVIAAARARVVGGPLPPPVAPVPTCVARRGRNGPRAGNHWFTGGHHQLAVGNLLSSGYPIGLRDSRARRRADAG